MFTRVFVCIRVQRAHLLTQLHMHTQLPEGENFTASAGAQWQPKAWADDGGLFASTVANTFMSRRAYLHAPANVSADDVARAKFSVSKTGSYSVLARYESGYRFQMPFRLEITKGSSIEAEPIFARTYGFRESLKVQALTLTLTLILDPRP